MVQVSPGISENLEAQEALLSQMKATLPRLSLPAPITTLKQTLKETTYQQR